VFVIAMENHNWTQPSTQPGPQQIFQNPAAPFINSLVNGTSGISNQVAYANAYINSGGVFTAPPGVNAYNYSNQYNYAAKHNPMVFFTDTNGGCNTTPSNPLSRNYAPLQQLALDLANNTVADYNWITPDQYNDQHSSLAKGYGQYPNSDTAAIAQGDNFLARVVPLIMSSAAYQDHGVIVLWWDESEGGDDPSRTLPFIVISQDAHKNVNGMPYSNTIQYCPSRSGSHLVHSK
jgi:hypothetical protein